MTSLLGIHDIEAVHHTPQGTWLVDTIALSESPPTKDYRVVASGLNIIVRCNWGYGSTGTLPAPERYGEYVEHLVAFVRGCAGCHRWVIGNEPNLSREWPDGWPILPSDYAVCYSASREAIRALPGHESDEVLVAGSGPWNNELKYDGNPNGDWVQYTCDCLRFLANEVDGVALHAYCHGYDPALAASTQRMNPPFENRYYNFLTFTDYLKAFPAVLTAAKFYITEANGDGPWQATGLIAAMLEEVDKWNWHQPMVVQCMVCFRYPNFDDGFHMQGKADVLAEYTAAAALYDTPHGGWVTPPQPTPPNPQPEPPPLERYVDPRLIERGVTFTYVTPVPGQPYWRMTWAEWLEDAAHQVGPDHHILGDILVDGLQAAGVSLRVTWPSGNTLILSKPDDPNATYNYDYGMSSSLNEYSIQVEDGLPSDKVSGIGMGKDGNPSEHTSTWVTFERVVVTETQPPIPPEPAGEVQTGVVVAYAGLNVRSGPDISFTQVGTLTFGSTVLFDNESQGWLRLAEGWVSGEYVGSPESLDNHIVPPSQPGAGGLVHPLPGSVKTQHFYQDPAAYEQWGLVGHDGTDLAGPPQGTPVLSVADGVVTVAAVDEDYGNYILVSHSERRCASMYCHASTLLVSPGQGVKAGEPVMLLGSTGTSSGPHLHFEIRLLNPDGSFRQDTPQLDGRVDPETYCSMNGLVL